MKWRQFVVSCPLTVVEGRDRIVLPRNLLGECIQTALVDSGPPMYLWDIVLRYMLSVSFAAYVYILLLARSKRGTEAGAGAGAAMLCYCGRC